MRVPGEGLRFRLKFTGGGRAAPGREGPTSIEPPRGTWWSGSCGKRAAHEGTTGGFLRRV